MMYDYHSILATDHISEDKEIDPTKLVMLKGRQRVAMFRNRVSSAEDCPSTETLR